MSALLIDLGRFRLRDFDVTDRAAFVAYQSEPRYSSLYDLDPRDLERGHELFDRFLEWQRTKPRSDFQLGIFDARTGKLCGSAGLREVRDRKAVLGIELAPDEWGRYALALDATAGLLQYGFERLDLDLIVGSTASGNARVAKLARRFNAKIVAEREGPTWMQARGWREVEWAIERAEWIRSPRSIGRNPPTSA